MSSLSGKFGLIVGVANKRSIAWAIAQAAAAAGARLALTYQGERLEENVRELAAGLDRSAAAPARRHRRRADRRASSRRSTQAFGGLDFVVHGAAFAPREELSNPFVADLARGIPHGARHQRLLADRAGARRAAADGAARRRQHPDADLSRQRARLPELQRDGRGEGGARSRRVRYLAADLGPKNIRVNAISAGPIKTLAASGISGFSSILQVYRDRAPLRRTVETTRSGRRRDVPAERCRPRASPREVLMVDGGYHATGM